jgi:serine protease Do
LPDSTNQPDTGTSKYVPFFVILSGPRRGQSEILGQKTYHIVMGADEAVRIMEPDGERIEDVQATLHRAIETYELEVAPNHSIWVNGEQVKVSRMLKPGDLLEIGHGGPVVRYRPYRPGGVPRKTFAEAVADSLNGAKADSHTSLGRISRFLSNITMDLATHTPLWFRVWVVIIITLLVVSVAILVLQSFQLQKRVASEDIRIGSIEERLEQQNIRSLSQEELLALQSEVKSRLADTMERLASLEDSSNKASRVIAAATPAVVFLLGSYGFVEPDSGRMFHYTEPSPGIVKYNFEEEGKVFEVIFTGTAFVGSGTGMLLTNRHVVEPWRGEPIPDITQGRQLSPRILKILAYYPGVSDPVAVEVVQVGEQLDLALLKSIQAIAGVKPLEIEPQIPQPGDEILLLGYPTGLRALVARVSTEFLASITPNGATEFWELAQQLSAAGYIKPLASSGIISQVTEHFIVYDAETTFGGSGGPVLDLNGHVIAINTAVLPEFGGSNMGLPAANMQQFLDQQLTRE